MKSYSHHFNTHPVKAITTHKTQQFVQPYIKKSSQVHMTALQICHVNTVHLHPRYRDYASKTLQHSTSSKIVRNEVPKPPDDHE